MQCLKCELAFYWHFMYSEIKWTTWWVSEWVNEWARVPASPQSAPVAQLLSIYLSQSLTSGSCSCCQTLVFLRLMVRYFWWRGSLGVIFMVPNITHSIFHPLSWTGAQWIRNKVSPLSTFLAHPGFITSIRLLLNSCLSHSIMATADSAVVLLELNVQWD